jgi:predicted transcriptional regulator
MRIFQLSRSSNREIVLMRSDPDSNVIETFTYGDVAKGKMQITWRVSRKAKPLEVGDRITCIKS